MLLGAALLYHALNGLRIVIMDFWPALTRYHRQLWCVNWVVFVDRRPAGRVSSSSSRSGAAEMSARPRSRRSGSRAEPAGGGFELASGT